MRIVPLLLATIGAAAFGLAAADSAQAQRLTAAASGKAADAFAQARRPRPADSGCTPISIPALFHDLSGAL